MEAIRTTIDPLELDSLFQDCDTISSLRYEGSESVGRVVFVPPDNDPEEATIRSAIRFADEIPLRQHVMARKLVQLTSSDVALISDGSRILGLSEKIVANTGGFEVHFLGHHTWELLQGCVSLMRVERGVPGLLRRLQREQFEAALRRSLPNKEPNSTVLWNVIEAAIKQRHGTAVVVTSKAATEAQRLGKQGIPVDPVQATPELLHRVTTIDGAVLIDEKGTCFGIGVILDGTATDEGTPSRGARYNSAIRYAAVHPGECLVIVVSEDGAVDLVSFP
jgi:DNA integrity scanning protein DisA with diadenylate cyclase activity